MLDVSEYPEFNEEEGGALQDDEEGVRPFSCGGEALGRRLAG